MNLLDTSPEPERTHQIQALQMAAQHLVDTPQRCGMVVTITLEQPGMSNYEAIIDLREVRHA